MAYGYYLHSVDINDPARIKTGVDHKIANQIRCFNDAGIHCEFLCCPQAQSRLRRGLGSLPMVTDGIGWPSPSEVSGASFIYIRRPLFFSREMLHFLRGVKEIDPDVTIIVELPTYPYDAEMQKPDLFFAYRKDRKYRNKLAPYVDYIADLSGENKIFDIPVLHIFNGIDLNAARTRKLSLEKNGSIHVLCAAYFEPWHGCDLLIEGLANYYRNGGERNLVLHLAGGGSQIPALKKLVATLGLDEHVIFYGPLDKGRLDMLFDQCTLAVGSLGLHRRSDLHLDSSLKTREYLAKGIPFIYAGKVDVFENHPVDFCLGFKSTEQPVDIKRVIGFYDELYSKYDEVELIAKIRAYAKCNVSMQKAMQNVIDLLLSITNPSD